MAKVDLIKVIGFDCFNTVFDMSSIPRESVANYVSGSLDCKDESWRPLYLPAEWYKLKAHPDAAPGIKSLRSKYIVTTMSNGPVELLSHISRANNISWDLITPIELLKVYKRNPEAYLTLCDLFRVHPTEVMIVTANPTFGDVEAAEKLGMQPCVIRNNHPAYPKDICDLAQRLLNR
jgi:2-haloalkanoic acid dehalogenase type II